MQLVLEGRLLAYNGLGIYWWLYWHFGWLNSLVETTIIQYTQLVRETNQESDLYITLLHTKLLILELIHFRNLTTLLTLLLSIQFDTCSMNMVKFRAPTRVTFSEQTRAFRTKAGSHNIAVLVKLLALEWLPAAPPTSSMWWERAREIIYVWTS